MKKYTLKAKRNKKKGSIQITLSGQLNVTTIADISEELKKALVDIKEINIEVKDVEDGDMTLMQMLKSVEQKCIQQNIELSISLNLNEDIQELFSRAGLIELINED